jgi:PAS domain S-box-containing protein
LPKLPPVLSDTRAILESMGDAFYALDAEWRFIYANQRALDFWGTTAETVIGRVIWQRFPQMLATQNELMLRGSRAEQRTISFEGPSPTTGVPVSITVCPTADGVCVYWRDISQRIDAEQALRRSEAHLRLAQEAGGIGTWEWDLRNDAMIWSAQMYRVMGFDPADARDPKTLLLAAFHPDERDVAEQEFAGFRSRTGPLRLEVRICGPDGAIRWIVFLGQVIAGMRGEPRRMLGITIDATSRRESERAIREDAERLRLAMQAGGLATWEFDVLNETRHWSAEAAVMHGFPPDKLAISRDEWRQMIHPDDLPHVREAFGDALAGLSDYRVEYRIVQPDGELRWTAVHGTWLRDTAGRPSRIFGVLQDVTERKAIEEALRRLNQELEARVATEVAAREAAQVRAAQAERMQALGQLAGGIAHDFNNVLQTIQGGAALIARRASDAAGVARLAGMILDAAGRGASITRRLLAFARHGDLRAEPVDVAALLEGLREVLEPALGPGVRLSIQATAGLPPLLADKGQLETALVNLAINARHAMPGGGALAISAVAEVAGDGHAAGPAPGRYVRLAVADTGEGMEPSVLSRALEPFFTTKPVGQGTGLGLPMVKGFAEQSGGAIAIDSARGRGTTVWLWLPQAEQETLAPVVAARGVGERARLLLVDDEALVREILVAQLEELGFEVLAAAGGEDALALLAAGERIDALITDLSMPQMDGLALIQAAQARRVGLPAVLLTGFAGDGATLALSGAISGSYTLLRKPVSAEALADRVGALLEGSRAGV